MTPGCPPIPQFAKFGHAHIGTSGSPSIIRSQHSYLPSVLGNFSSSIPELKIEKIKRGEIEGLAVVQLM